MDKSAILAHRLQRQGLVCPARTEAEYLSLLRALQPVAPIHFSRPGSPPRLAHRTAFYDGQRADELRGRRALVKGRFWGGNIGYVLAEELALYAAAFCQPLWRLTQVQEQILRTLKYEGPLTPRQLRQETGVRHRRLMPALHRLQQAFLVYEDQEDSDWERPFALFAAEWPDLEIKGQGQEAARARVLDRVLQSLVFATPEQCKDWSQWPSAQISKALDRLAAEGRAVCLVVEGLGEGWQWSGEQGGGPQQPERKTFMLHKADFLAKAHASELKRRFNGAEVLQYLLIDGEFKGAVCGHWRIGPHDVEDILLELSRREVASRKQEILAAVALEYCPPRSKIRRFIGRRL